MNGGGAASHDQSVGLLAGTALGGGTLVNYTTSFRTPDEVREEWAAQGAALRDSLTRAIARQTERGVLDVPDPEVASEQFMLLTAGNALTLATFGVRRLGDAELGRIVDQGIDLWLRGYRAPTASTASRRRRATSG